MPSSPNLTSAPVAVLDAATEEQMLRTLGRLSAACGLPDTGTPLRPTALWDTTERTVELYLNDPQVYERWVTELVAKPDPVLPAYPALRQGPVHRAVAELDGWTYALVHAEPYRPEPVELAPVPAAAVPAGPPVPAAVVPAGTGKRPGKRAGK